jgi:hypothetical protein
MRKVLLAVFVVAAHVTQARASDRAHDALERARRLVGLEVAVKVVLIDPELAPDSESLRGLDAFIVRERGGSLRPTIYVNQRSEIVRRAAAGSEFYVHVLAAVIHHEARHLEGASEAEARRAEVDFFRTLMARGDVSPAQGLQYLARLTRRE